MKKINHLLVGLIVLCAMSACRKESVATQKESSGAGSQTQKITTPPAEVSTIVNPQFIISELEEISPGVWRTTEPYQGAILTFRNIRFYGNYPYAEFVSVVQWGTYLPMLSGDHATRIFAYPQTYCTGNITKTEKKQTYLEFTAVLPDGTTYVKVADQFVPGATFLLSDPLIANLAEVDFTVTPKASKITRLEVADMNCNNTRIVTGKIIAEKQSDGSPKFRLATVGYPEKMFLEEQ